MPPKNVLIFGPTGNIGSIAALTAHARGAHVYLAMRDPSKPIPGLSASDEASGNYTRLQADITKPSTITAAVTRSQPQSAFFYLNWGMPDHMASAIQTLKDAGVPFVVFLSSFTVTGPLDAFTPAEAIPYAHAQVEKNLEKIYGPAGYVAVRPGHFATNTLGWNSSVQGGKLDMQEPGACFDYITPDDMGAVSGSILAAGGQKDGERHVFVFGPEMIPQREAVGIVCGIKGKEVSVQKISVEESTRELEGAGWPAPMVKYMVGMFVAMGESDGGVSKRPEYEEGRRSVVKYAGQQPMTFREWVERNQGLYTF